MGGWGWVGVVGLAENKANSAPIEVELELELSLAKIELSINILHRYFSSSFGVYSKLLE